MLLIRALVSITALVLILNQSHFFEDPDYGPPTWLVASRFALLLAFCLVGAIDMLQGRSTRRLAAVDVPIGCFLLLAFASSQYSIDLSFTINRAVSATLLYVAVFWTVWSWAERYGTKPIVDSLVLAAAIVFVAGLLLVPATSQAWQEDGRFRGCMVNPNTLGLLAALFAPLITWRFLERRQWMDLAVLGAIWLSLILAATRNGLIASLVGTAIVLYWGIARKWFVFIAIGFAAATGVLISSVESLSADSALARLAPGADVGSAGRTEMWEVGWDLVQQSPLFGHGFGTEDLAFYEGSFREYEGKRFHNSYLGMAFELGFVGVIVFYGPLLLLALRQMWRQRAVKELGLQHALLGVVVAGLVSAFFESWIYSVGNALSFPFWTCVALLVKASIVDKRSTIRRPPALGAPRIPGTPERAQVPQLH